MNKIAVAKTVAYSIAAVAAISSFGHQVALLGAADLDPLFGYVPAEWVTPITVDALAIVALMVRTHEDVTAKTKQWALLPLILAGGMSIAANVATAHNLIGVIVGIWTVLAYIVAELFVAKMERKAPAKDSKRSAAARKGAETKRRNKANAARTTRRPRTPRAPAAVPVSPATVAEIDSIVA